MRNSPLGTGLGLWLCLFFGVPAAHAEKNLVLESSHYRIHYAKKNEAVAGEALRIAEGVWPGLARAYDAYNNFQIIDIFLLDPGDVANGDALYEYSRVEIYLPHLNWVMRGRANWLGNVVAHEISHVFSLRQKARLWIFSDAELSAYTFNRQVNWSFTLPWSPLPAPSWWVEGIAQFESEVAGYDTWDSQRDMIVRDAWLTGTLPTLGDIETYDGDWLQGERVYNTGFAFLRYLRDRYGLDKVRRLAVPKPFFHFGGAVEAVYGKSLSSLFEEWKGSLEERYADFKGLNKDTLFDADIRGSFTQNLAISPDGKTIAWLGNGDRQTPLNWIYWKDETGGVHRSANGVSEAPGNAKFAPARDAVDPIPQSGIPFFGMSTHPMLRRRAPMRYSQPPLHPTQAFPQGRSDEISSNGLEFNRDGTRLLTTRNDWDSPYNDIWEYEFRADKSEAEKWHRLTWNIRASYASYHPTLRQTVVFAQFDDGSSNVSVLDSTGRIHQLTRFREGQQVYNPVFTPKGDSIYFTLGIGDKEAIASIAANAPAYDRFAAADDSSAFPDSQYLAKGQRVRFVTPLGKGSVRDLRFAGDTLVFSSNASDGVYNVFARIQHRIDTVVTDSSAPGDTAHVQRTSTELFRLTRSRGQALEPLIRDGKLYYQGYERQQFRVFREALTLDSVASWTWPADSIPVLRPKAKDYSKILEVGEPGVKKVAWSISPYLNLSPQFLDDTTLTALNLNLGLRVDLGPVSEGPNQSLSGYISKSADFNNPIDYGLGYAGVWKGITSWHQRLGWTPNLSYSLSHDVRHRNFNSNFNDTLIDTTTSDHIGVDHLIFNQLTFSYDMVDGAVDLPLNGMRLGPGFLQTQWYGRYWNENLAFHVNETDHYTDLTTSAQGDASGDIQLWDASMQRTFFHNVMLQWAVPALATPLPRYFGVFAGLGQWWARYALNPIPTDSLPAAATQSILNGDPLTFYQFPKADFAPWQTDFGWFWAWSQGENFQISFAHRMGFFTHKFPMQSDTLAVAPGVPDSVVQNPQSNLWVMPYRLGLYMLPAYPYSFSYRGHDLLSGTAMSWAHLQADFPVKIRQFLDYPSPFSSLNKVQFSAMGDAGAVLNKTPDQLIDALQNGEHHLLLDYGAKVSMTFLFYHWIPMELYAMAYMPYNQLKADRLYQGDWKDNGYVSPQAYLRNMQEPRYFVGLTLGNL